ncbi:MAG: hypothetical protein EOM05_11335, partial [Clostridia bacterium]|nr:hypothetical protein [Clostridia bacterium]
MFKLKEWIPTILGVLLIGIVFLFVPKQQVGQQPLGEQLLGASFPESQWMHFNQFSGYQTDVDPEKVLDGSNPQGQNTTVFET